MTGDLTGSLGLAAAAGVATFFSPCAYALLPGYVGFYAASTTGDDRAPLPGALIRGTAAAVGVLSVFAGLGALVAVAGDLVAPVVPVVDWVVGPVLVSLGVATLLGVDATRHVRLPRRRTTVTGFALFGVLYAAAAAGCVAPVVLAVVFEAVARGPVGAAITAGTFGATVAALLLATTVALAVGVDASTDRLPVDPRTAAGALLVVAGVAEFALAVNPDWFRIAG